jgi:hypothetical protein
MKMLVMIEDRKKADGKDNDEAIAARYALHGPGTKVL